MNVEDVSKATVVASSILHKEEDEEEERSHCRTAPIHSEGALCILNIWQTGKYIPEKRKLKKIFQEILFIGMSGITFVKIFCMKQCSLGNICKYVRLLLRVMSRNANSFPINERLGNTSRNFVQ